jgi:hypothetical protein
MAAGIVDSDRIGRSAEYLGAITTRLFRRVQCSVGRPFQRLCANSMIWNSNSLAQADASIDLGNSEKHIQILEATWPGQMETLAIGNT